VAFLAGWAILRIAALIPILGGLVWFAAVVVGLGALAVASGEPAVPASHRRPNTGLTRPSPSLLCRAHVADAARR
jgi:hypothetical protein